MSDSDSSGSEQSDPSAGREVRKRKRLRKIELDTKEMHPYR